MASFSLSKILCAISLPLCFKSSYIRVSSCTILSKFNFGYIAMK
ncbi:hypothetical protein HMPREF1139_0239 [Campylobacter sp. FOBRC14]|nr:hypothetical protein HMPREF1139_0239 [Campylobacter sp. FOBRC14]